MSPKHTAPKPFKQDLVELMRASIKERNAEATSTRQPGYPDNQEIQEIQENQDLQESHEGDSHSQVNDFSELFKKGRFSEIPEPEFIALALSASQENDWSSTGSSPTWEFCRFLLAHPSFSSLRGAKLVRRLRRFPDLYEAEIDMILTEIDRVTFAKGAGPLDWAFGMADQYPLSDPEDLGLSGYDRFLSVAGWLQVMRGDAPILLPVEKLAPIFGVTAKSISLWRARAVQQGLLRETSPYAMRKKATEFRFAVDRFGVLRERKNM